MELSHSPLCLSSGFMRSSLRQLMDVRTTVGSSMGPPPGDVKPWILCAVQVSASLSPGSDPDQRLCP